MITFFRRIVAFFTTLATLISSFLGLGLNFGNKVDDFRVTAYIRASFIQSEDNIYAEDFDIITDVILFECASFNSVGEIIIEKEMLESTLGIIRKAIGNRDVNITLNLFGPSGETDSDDWNEKMEAQSDEHNKAFTSGVLEENIKSVLEKYGFSGVHFDYEYPISRKAWNYFNDFLVSLDKKLGDYTIGVACSDWNLQFTTAAINAIDTFELMAYDFNDSEGRHSTYEDTVKAANNIGLYGIPLEKINIGLPFYSRPTDMSLYWYAYNGYYEEIDENGWYHCDNLDKDFWFNTPDVIYRKTEFAVKNGYGGVMTFHYNCDLPSSDEASLLRAIGKAVSDNY